MNLFFLLPQGDAAASESVGLQGGTVIALGIGTGTDHHIRWSASAITGSNGLVRGKMMVDDHQQSVAVAYTARHSWVSPSDFADEYWIRATSSSGDAPDSGAGVGTWVALAKDVAAPFWQWTHNGPVVHGGAILLEIATDDAGVTVVASGTYSAFVSVED